MLDVGVDLKRQFTEHMYSGCMLPHGLLDGPLMSFQPPEPFQHGELLPIYNVLGLNKVLNPAFHTYKTMLEVDHRNGLPIIGPASVRRFMANARERSPLVSTMERGGALYDSLHLITTNRVTTTRKNGVLLAGDVHLRAGGIERFYTNEVGQRIAADAVAATVTAEQLMFPALFPQGDAFYEPLYKGFTFQEYCKMRASTFCSLFTLTPAYMLTAYNLRQSNLMAESIKDVALERDVLRIMETTGATRPEALQKVSKFSVPGTLQNVPAYYRGCLSDLFTRVETHGMPDLFVTLTIDETSELRWQEIKDLETFMEHFNSGDKVFTYRDAPVECCRIFYHKYQVAMEKLILGGPRMFGKIRQHVTRFEVQARGSLHAHIMLWVDPKDIDRVADEITATVPAEYDTTRGCFILPPDPHQRKLVKIVSFTMAS